MSDGKQLEALVSFVEETLASGFTVNTNQRVFNDDGVQIAEFDVEVVGKLGSTEIRWLIECRDRPGEGPAPGSWIEQLVGRRTRFGFNKVTAVSTTGFASPASDFAKSQGIELREVASLEPHSFRWLTMQSVTMRNQITDLRHAEIRIGELESNEAKTAAAALVGAPEDNPLRLRSTANGTYWSLSQAFLNAVEQAGGLFDDVVEDGPDKPIELTVGYASDTDHFVLDTAVGPVRVRSINFTGVLRIQLSTIPLVSSTEYRQFDSKDTISQVASFAPRELLGTMTSLEIHRIPKSGKIHVRLRPTSDVI